MTARRPSPWVAVTLVSALLAGGCGGDHPAAPPTPAGAEAALAARLRQRDLSLRYVSCVDEGVRRGGDTVFRCNVNFGEPHIWPYCVVVREGAAVTHEEDASLRCRRTRTGDEP